MPRKPLELPPEVVRNFVCDMHAFITEKNGVNAIGTLAVTDGGSSLRNTWMMLWPLAEAYGYTYWWALALIVPALLVALLLPRVKPEPVVDEDGASDAAPVLMHA